jgi:hypothetical protein
MICAECPLRSLTHPLCELVLMHAQTIGAMLASSPVASLAYIGEKMYRSVRSLQVQPAVTPPQMVRRALPKPRRDHRQRPALLLYRPHDLQRLAVLHVHGQRRVRTPG